jgi:hypothetical protein
MITAFLLLCSFVLCERRKGITRNRIEKSSKQSYGFADSIFDGSSKILKKLLWRRSCTQDYYAQIRAHTSVTRISPHYFAFETKPTNFKIQHTVQHKTHQNNCCKQQTEPK